MKKIAVYFALVCVSLTHTQAQQRLIATGDRHYEDLAFIRALDYYQKAYEKDTANDQLVLKIAESYRQLNDPVQAEAWYGRVIQHRSVSPIHKLYYAEALGSNGKYQQAREWYEQYKQEAGKERRVTNRIQGIEHQQAFYQQQATITVEEVSFNTALADFSPTFYKDQLVFVSARNSKANAFVWDNSHYLDLYQVGIHANQPAPFESSINSKYHEGPAVFFDNGSKVIFTRSDYHKRKLGRSEEGVNTLKLFYAEKQADGSWGKSQPLPFNSSEYSTGHPTLSSDMTLYFVSDMPGGFGGTDLYKCAFVNGAWQQPVNLGENINTEGDEMFPYLHQDRELYFASNGRPGLGGLDIYGVEVSRLAGGKVLNVGFPVNSSADDFSLVLDSTSLDGYFSTNRSGGTGSDDIYHLTTLKPLLSPYQVKGKITDQKDGSPLAGAQVTLSSETGKPLTTTTAKDGSYIFAVHPDMQYQIQAQQPEYLENRAAVLTTSTQLETEWEVNLSLLKKHGFSLFGIIAERQSGQAIQAVQLTLIDNMTGKTVLETTTDPQGAFEYVLEDKKLKDRISYQLKLSKAGYLSKTTTINSQLTQPGRINLNDILQVSLDKIEVGTDIGSLIDIQPIYFDLGKSTIRPDAAKELNKIVKIMQENPNIAIELGSHTDARGSAASNLQLSDQRATASAAYIISQGIHRDRIIGKGYGESVIINSCADGIKCTEEEHQKNRRTEFTVTQF